MRFIHTSDLHIGSHRDFPDYLKRQEDMLNGIFLIAKKKKCRLILISGDLYDRINLKEEERNLLIKVFVKWLKKGYHICCINGNHDFYTEEKTLIEVMTEVGKLSDNFHSVIMSPGIIDLSDEFGIVLSCIPCQQNLTKTKIKEIVSKHYHSLDEKPEKFIVMLHECIGGAVLDEGFKLEGTKIPKLSYVDYWALGDIHKCFPGNTQVMIDYDKCLPIETIYKNKEITHVLSYDLKKKKIVKKKVVHRFKRKYEGKYCWLELKVNGKKSYLKATETHGFHVIGKGKVPLKDIEKNDKLIYYNGNFKRVYFDKKDKKIINNLKDKQSKTLSDRNKYSKIHCDLCNKTYTYSKYASHFQQIHKELIPSINKKIKCEKCEKTFSEAHIGAHFFHKHTRKGKEFSELLSERIKKGYKNNPDLLKLRAKHMKKRVKALWEQGILEVTNKSNGGWKQNKVEALVDSWNIKGLKYTGDRRCYIPILYKGKRKRKNPDFIWKEKGKIKKVVEIMGFPWYHDESEIKPLKRSYNKINIDCMIIDSRRLSTKHGQKEVRGEIEAFLNNHTVEVFRVTKPRKGRSKKYVYNLEVYGTHNYFVVTNSSKEHIGEVKPQIPVLVYNCQKVAPRAYYSGSPVQLKFGDHFPKGVIYYNDGKVKLLSIKGIPRLLTVKQGNDIPENAIVRYIRTDLLSDDKELPPNVVNVKTEIPERESIEIDDLNNIVAGLPEFVNKKYGFDEDLQSKCVSIVKTIASKELDNNETNDN